MEFVYHADENEIEAYMRDPKTGIIKNPVKLSRHLVDELTKKVMEEFALDYDTAFDMAVYLAYIKTVWVN